MLQRVARYFLARPLLVLLLAADLVFIAAHVWLSSRGALSSDYNLARADSFPEYYQYAKWLACTALCTWAFARRRDALYLAWAALFLYLLLDDALELHEKIGISIAKSLAFVPALGLRAKDFGEIAVTLIAGLLLIGLIAICHRRSDDDRARALTWALLPWLGLLVFSGLFMDMAHGMIRAFGGGQLAVMISGVFEDGGEMIAASFLTATVARAVLFPEGLPALRIGPLVAALPGWAKKAAQPANAYALASLLAVVLIVLVMAAAIVIYALDLTVKGRSLYTWLLREDGPVEKPTAILLGLGALFALIATFRVPPALRWARPFLILFAAFSALMALEEISWGQRALELEPGAFFQEHSDQQEINIHNVVQHYLKRHDYPITKTRKIAALVLVVYGVVLPILNAFERPKALLRRLRLVVPPPALMLGFLLGALLAWFDWPTRREEEIGELLFSLCFAMLVPLWRLQQRYEAHALWSQPALMPK
jgi:hypothetical protein